MYFLPLPHEQGSFLDLQTLAEGNDLPIGDEQAFVLDLVVGKVGVVEVLEIRILYEVDLSPG